MRVGRVVGSVWATRKDPSLEGRRMLVVQPVGRDGADRGRPTVALDTADAGPGDTVLYVTSAEAAIPFRPARDLTATDATIVGVVDPPSRRGGPARS